MWMKPWLSSPIRLAAGTRTFEKLSSAVSDSSSPDDQVLGAAYEVDEPVVVDPGEVAGVEPALAQLAQPVQNWPVGTPVPLAPTLAAALRDGLL